ncbi:ammonium transporter Rh type B-like isoform X2 [Dreissena polymorpha]|nr:ammonium transporter Rh type B-like isoform X2 [Dreissena polymorpha]
MIYIGFGFLMTFLSRYGYTAVGINFFLASIAVQWAILVRGFTKYEVFKGDKYDAVAKELISLDFAAATVLISFGAVLGKTTPLQLLVMTLIEIVVAQINQLICTRFFSASDIGESMYIHAFGAYFGLAVSRVLYDKRVKDATKAKPVYHSDHFSMIGTIFLWLYWPSFNGGAASDDEQQRAYINTYLSLAACTVVTFALCAIYDENGKFKMEYIQNSTLAGGVAVGTTANMPLHPFGALIMGSVAAIISVTGYRFGSAFLADKLRIHDTCGVHNLHGMPALLAAIAGAVLAAMGSTEKWGQSYHQIFPHTAPISEGGKGWTNIQQGGYQMAALALTLGIAIFTGIITGFMMKLPIFDQDQIKDADDMFEDSVFWVLHEEEHLPMKHGGEQNGDKHKEMELRQRTTVGEHGIHL